MKKLGIVLFLSGVFGCGAELPMNSDRPDAGTPDVQMDRDVPNVDDRTAPPPDAQPDQPVPPPDAPPPPEDRPPAMVCRPALSPPQTCEGQLCQPNEVRPTCEGASGCDCNMRAEDMPAMICTPQNMPTCMSMVSCSPGRNHCSINLPEDVNYMTVPVLDPDRESKRGGLRRTLGEGWRREDLASGSASFTRGALFSAPGFVVICGRFPADLWTLPEEMRGQPFCAECANMTCYWNRGALRRQMPSVEIMIGQLGCSLEMRYYLTGGTSPELVHRYNSLSTFC